MTIRIDSERHTLTAPVGELARVGCGGGATREIGLGGGGLSRLWLGQQHHQRLQAERDATVDGYRAEVSVAGALVVGDWTLELSGRADGVVFDGDGAALEVEEYKTLHLGRDLFGPTADDTREAHRRQVQLYAMLLSPPEAPAAAVLTLIDVVDGRTVREEQDWTHAELEGWLRGVLQRLLADDAERRAHRQACARAAETLPFPHPTVRPSQDAMLAAVDDAVGSGRHLLVCAPTGVGKTAAALYPALRQALSSGRTVFLLTAKTLQQEMAVTTARAMQGKSSAWHSLQLRAKARMCANGEMVCHEDSCPYAAGYGRKVAAGDLLRRLLTAGGHLDPDAIFALGEAEQVCPFELSLDLIEHVDLVVCDYNYVFDPRIGLHALAGDGLLPDTVLLIDEAHNLVERARDYYSPVLSRERIRDALDRLSTRNTKTFTRIHDVFADLRDYLDDAVDEAFCGVQADPRRRTAIAHADLDAEPLYRARRQLDPLLIRYVQFKRDHELFEPDDPVMALYFELVHFHRVLTLGGDVFEHLARRGPDGDDLKVLCLDASRFVGETLAASAGAVAMSATLEPFPFYRELLGFDAARTDELSLPPPFPRERCLVRIVDGVDTTYRQRAKHFGRIAEVVADAAPPGRNALALFPSYVFLDEIERRIDAPRHRVLAQQRGGDPRDQRRLLRALQAGGEPTLLLAVLGGMFAEGVDFPGDALSAVFVVSPGLPQVEPERELLLDYYRMVYDDGFAYAYLVPGMRRVVQAAGRLIRSERDRGAIVLVGRRFLQPRYARYLPDYWTGGDVRALRTDDPAPDVRAFFEPNDDPATAR